MCVTAESSACHIAAIFMPVILVIFIVAHTSSVNYPQTGAGVSSRGAQDVTPFLIPGFPSPHMCTPFQKVTAGSLPGPGSLPATGWPHPTAARLPWPRMNGIPQGPAGVWSPRLCPQQALEPGRARQAARASLVGCPTTPSGSLYSGSCNLDRLPRPNCYLRQQSPFPLALPTPTSLALHKQLPAALLSWAPVALGRRPCHPGDTNDPSILPPPGGVRRAQCGQRRDGSLRRQSPI